MKNSWSTKKQDMQDAQQILSYFGGDDEALSIFEIATDLMGNIHNISLAPWVIVLTKHFRKRYGAQEGDEVMKQILSQNLINNATVH